MIKISQTIKKKLQEVFERLRQFNLKLKPSKCEFTSKEVNYLGARTYNYRQKSAPWSTENSICKGLPNPTEQ